MRRIKTYVMTIGVALSVAPIFNYALAQQASNSTELLLQVQEMRQEIGELRDVVERQQFQFRRLQQQFEAQSRQLNQGQGADPSAANNYGAPDNYDQPNYNSANTGGTAGSTPSYSDQKYAGDGSLSGPVGGTYAGQQNSAPQVFDSTNSNSTSPAYTLPNANTGSNIPNGSTQQPNWNTTQGQNPAVQDYSDTEDLVAAHQNEYSRSRPGAAQAAGQQPIAQVDAGQAGSGNSNYAPVVDRSVGTSNPSVAVTGSGTQQPSSGGFQATPIQQSPGQQASGQVIQSRQNPSSSGGIISIPPQVAAIENQAPSAIDASRVPTQPNQAGSQAGSSVLSEVDYYDQGFDLLKQSKYEEASSIFEQQLQAYPSGDLADDAHYWIAEAMHVSRKLDVAKFHLKAIIRDHPQSRRLPDAMLKTAYIEQSQGNQIEARILFQEIVNLHPQSDAAIAAKNQLAAVN